MLKTLFHQKHLSETSTIGKNFYSNYLIKQLDKVKSENRHRAFNQNEKNNSKGQFKFFDLIDNETILKICNSQISCK